MFMKKVDLLRRSAAGLVLGMVVLLANSAQAMDWYVDPLGTDAIGKGTGPGTDAYRTIRFGVGHMTNAVNPTTAATDILHVAAGYYTEPNIIINSNGVISGAGPGQTIVQATSSWSPFATSSATTSNVFTIVSKTLPLGTATTNITLANMTIRYGYANGGGAGIAANASANTYDPILTVSNCVVCSNLQYAISSGNPGGASFCFGVVGGPYKGTINLLDSSFLNNITSATPPAGNGPRGGCAAIWATNITVRGCTFAYNIVSNTQLSSYGGALLLGGGTTGLIQNCTIASNGWKDGNGNCPSIYGGLNINSGFYATGPGGANGGLCIQGCTIVGNIASNSGGGLYLGLVTTSAVWTIENCVIAGNQLAKPSGTGLGPDIYSSYSSSTFPKPIERNNVIGNCASNGLNGTSTANWLSWSTNVVGGVTSVLKNANNSWVGSNNVPVTVNLGPLQNNGGKTMTVAQQPGSVAIDNGVNNTYNGITLTYDQRGVGYPRTTGTATDIGSYEYIPPTGLKFSNTNFYETTGLNDGSVNTTNTFTLANDTFSQTAGIDLLAGTPTYASLSPAPPGGLTAHLVVSNSTVANFYFSGNALPHRAANSVGNLVLTFSNTAFALGAVLSPTNAITTNNITFYDTTLTLSSTNFVETPGLNNGSVNTTNTFTLANDTFSQAQTTDLYPAYVSFTSGTVPSGLTPHVMVGNGQAVASFYFTGQASSYLAAQSVSNLVLIFKSTAFASGYVPAVGNTNTTNCITFYDTTLTPSSTNFYADASAYDGSITNTVTITLANESFASALVSAGDDLLTSANGGPFATLSPAAPGGLTPHVTVLNASTASFTFSGNASAPHEAINSVSNLVLTLNAGAFASLTTPLRNVTTNCITFPDTPSGGTLSPASVNFFETPLANDGSVSTTNTIGLVNETFASGLVGTDLYSTYVSISGVPAGLTPHVWVTSASSAKFYFTDKASPHRASDSAANVVLTFNSTLAFTSGNLPAGAQFTNSITFYDSSLGQSATNFYATPGANNGSVNTTNTITLANDTFNNVGSELYGASVNIISGTVPPGLTPHVKVKDSATASFYFTGLATLHAAAQSVSNLVLSFSGSSAFGSGNLPLSGTSTVNCITFYNSAGALSQGSANFVETPGLNDGSVNTTNTITLAGDTFTQPIGTDLSATYVSITSGTVPPGLIAHVSNTSATAASFYFTGKATAHQAANSVSNLVLTFHAAAFAGGLAATNAVTTNNITFYDDILTWSSTNFVAAQVDGSVPTTNTITADTIAAVNDPFAPGIRGAILDNTSNTWVTFSGSTIPTGLTPQITISSDGTAAQIGFKGLASPHFAANSVSNLIVTFLSTAFASGTLPLNYARTNCVTFTSPAITWGGSFTELMPDNNGAIDPAAYVIGTLMGDTFASASPAFTPASLPSGLTMNVTTTSPTTVQVTLTGRATAHGAANSTNNLGLTFNDSAFTGNNAAGVTGYNPANWSVTFYDPTKTWYVAATNATPVAGSDTNGTGTSGAPYATITKAISVAGSWDTIHVLPGIITDGGAGGGRGIWVQKPLLFEGEDSLTQHGISIVQASNTMSAASNRVFYMYEATACTYASFRNLTIRNGNDIVAAYPGGGGILCYNPNTLIVSNCLIYNCSSTNGYGGGIYAGASTGGQKVYIYNSIICSNTSGRQGGGVGLNGAALPAPQSVWLYDTAIFGNQTPTNLWGSPPPSGWGTIPGLFLTSCYTALVQNCTICCNTGMGVSVIFGSGGGAVYYNGLYNNALGLTIRNCTIASNAAPNGLVGGLGYNTASSLYLYSTIIAMNTASNNAAPDIRNTSGGSGPALESYNLIGDTTNSMQSGTTVITNGLPNANGSYVGNSGTAQGVVNPRLLPLAYNGGSTPTMALQAGSLAINAGSNPGNIPYDQRGSSYNRVVGSQADIGAFEFGAGPPTGLIIYLY